MLRERPLRQRLITLVRLISDYYWTCSECYWKAPMDPTPMEALEQFWVHVCADYPVPTGPMPATANRAPNFT
jgi:hypothetical protein